MPWTVQAGVRLPADVQYVLMSGQVYNHMPPDQPMPSYRCRTLEDYMVIQRRSCLGASALRKTVEKMRTKGMSPKQNTETRRMQLFGRTYDGFPERVYIPCK
jgi:hypothetical protein